MSRWPTFRARSIRFAEDSKKPRPLAARQRPSTCGRCGVASFLGRGWRYLGAAVGDALDRISDPRLQVQMALEEARRRHQLLTEQAAAVLGNERELEIKVGRAMADVERLRTAAGRALVLADRAYRDGDDAQGRGHDETAALFAGQLAGSGAGARMLEIERAGLEETGRQKLLEIRHALGLPERAGPSSVGKELPQ